LKIQRGRLSDLAHDREAWLKAYEFSIADDFRTILPALVYERPRTILDIGGGLGGIDARINEYYGGNCSVVIVDGLSDPPVVEAHRKTFSHAQVTWEFLTLNGVRDVTCLGPEPMGSCPAELILSFAAWCFHFPPEPLLDFVAASRNGTVIVDVRKDKPEWLYTLTQALGKFYVLHDTPKFQRCCFA